VEAKAYWIEISLTVDGELAEALAEAISRYVVNGVVVESEAISQPDNAEGIPSTIAKVYGYIPVDDKLEETRQKIEEALWYLGRIQPLPQASYRKIEEENWMAAWKTRYRPIPIGERLLVLPAWMEHPDPSRMAIRIDPSMAFGTGTHPSTQLCLQMTDKYTQPGQRAIDIGCGSGILSIGAALLGASQVLSVDIDPESVKATRENGAANAVLTQLEIGSGSVKEVLRGDFSFNQAPLVLVNILAPIILQLFADGLADLVAPGGKLVMAGILEPQAQSVEQAAESLGLRKIDHGQINDWVCLVYEK
jgi:ribosomal protein L11 methyltransferase